MVHVVVRVQVGGEGADELQEPRDLPLDLRVDAFGVVRGELQMQPQAQDRTLSREGGRRLARRSVHQEDRKSTRLNSSHGYISYAVFCLKKKKKNEERDSVITKASVLVTT